MLLIMTKKKPKRIKRVTTRLDPKTHDKLKRESERTGVSIVRLIRNAVDAMLGGSNKQKKR